MTSVINMRKCSKQVLTKATSVADGIKNAPHIFGARDGVHIIDLQKTSGVLRKAFDFVEKIAARAEKFFL